MSQDDVLFGYRLQLFDLAGRVGVTAACRVFGVHRSTYYVWRRRVERLHVRSLVVPVIPLSPANAERKATCEGRIVVLRAPPTRPLLTLPGDA
jgi:hypothetical protein